MSLQEKIVYNIQYVEWKLNRPLSKAEADTMTNVVKRDSRGIECAVCDDMKWLGYDVGVDHPNFGKSIACPHCPITDDGSNAGMLLRAAGLPPKPMSMEHFVPSKQPNLKAENQARLAKNRIVAWTNSGEPLLVAVTGPTGCGKSHLGQGAAALLCEGGKNVWYLTGAILSQKMKSSDVNTFKNRVMEVPYLVLDEAYVSYDPSGYIQASVSEILSYRYDRQLPSLMLGNIMDEKGKSNEEKLSNVIGQRLTSRLLSNDNGVLLSMWGCKDIRRVK